MSALCAPLLVTIFLVTISQTACFHPAAFAQSSLLRLAADSRRVPAVLKMQARPGNEPLRSDGPVRTPSAPHYLLQVCIQV